MYQGDYTPRTWTQTTIGYEFEDENGRFFTNEPDFDFTQSIPGLRLNHALYLQQRVAWKRLSAIGGVRYAHNETFGDKAVPRVALIFVALKGGEKLSGTRLRFSYSTGIKEPRFEESFPNDAFTKPNPNLKAEENRAFEAGFEQSLFSGKYSLSTIYFNNLFQRQIDFSCCDTQFRGHDPTQKRHFAGVVALSVRYHPLMSTAWVASLYSSIQSEAAPAAVRRPLALSATNSLIVTAACADAAKANRQPTPTHAASTRESTA